MYMGDRTSALTAILLVGFIPTISIVFTLYYNDDELTSQIFFMACKIWIFVVPTYWFLKIEGNPISWSKPDRSGVVLSLIHI